MKSTYFGVLCFAWVKSYFQQITITYYVWILQVDLNCYFYFFSYTFFEIWDSKAWLGVWTLTNLTWTRLCARTRYLMSIPINVRWPTFFEWYQSNWLYFRLMSPLKYPSLLHICLQRNRSMILSKQIRHYRFDRRHWCRANNKKTF